MSSAASKKSHGKKQLLRPANTPAQKRPTARERNRVRMHDDIYQAALSLFEVRGYAEVTVDEICAEAGISKATFFRYYENKFGLVDEFNQRMAAKIDASIDIEKMSAVECIRHATQTVYQEWVSTAHQIRLLAREFVRAGAHITENLGDPMAHGLISTLILVITKGQERGELDSQFDPTLVAPMIVMAWTISFAAWVDRDDLEGFRKSIHNLVEMQILGQTYNITRKS